MKKILILGSTKVVDDNKQGQHSPKDYFGEDIKRTYIDLDDNADIIADLNKLPYK